jgi:hypothetical protein
MSGSRNPFDGWGRNKSGREVKYLTLSLDTRARRGTGAYHPLGQAARNQRVGANRCSLPHRYTGKYRAARTDRDMLTDANGRDFGFGAPFREGAVGHVAAREVVACGKQAAPVRHACEIANEHAAAAANNYVCVDMDIAANLERTRADDGAEAINPRVVVKLNVFWAHDCAGFRNLNVFANKVESKAAELV